MSEIKFGQLNDPLSWDLPKDHEPGLLQRTIVAVCDDKVEIREVWDTSIEGCPIKIVPPIPNTPTEHEP